MGKSGILLIAAGKGSYAGWAANMAASLRYWNPDIQIALAVNGQAGQLATEPLYDKVIPIPDEYCTGEDGYFSPGKLKLHMDLLTPFEQTMYLDVDGLCLKPIAPLFELLNGRKVASQVVSETKTDADWWPCKWMPFESVKRVYPVKDGVIQEINSSFIYFEKDSAEYFEKARECYIDDYKTQWGNAFPDELAFNVAANICGIDLKIWDEPKAESPVSFKGDAKEYFVGLFGGMNSGGIKPMKVYEQAIRRPYLSVMGTFSPHKPHILMRQKFIMNGQVKMGSVPKEPRPYITYDVKPAEKANVKREYTIGIGITTHNRNANAEKCLKEITRFAPKGAKIVVVDDASAVPFKGAAFRFNHNVGIAAAKNKCLELLDDCDYVFLFDDDTWPKSEKWWLPYINSGVHHLSFTFDKLANGMPNGNGVFRRDGDVKYHYNPCGCVLFFTRECIDKVGGFNIGFGKYGNEHVDLSVRAYNAGLIAHPFMDVEGSLGLFQSLDYLQRTKSSVAKREVNQTKPLIGKSGKLEYKTGGEPFTVVGSYFTYQPDPQRGVNWKPDYNAVKNWIHSVTDCGGQVILLHDCFDTYPHTEGVKFVKVEPPKGYSPGQCRFMLYAEIIEQHLQTDAVFFTDCTDVICMKTPQTESGVIYAGDEHGQAVSCKWMSDTHNSILKIPDYIDFMKSVKDMPLLNVGIVGGRKETVMPFIRKIAEYAVEYGKTEKPVDMGILNYTAYKHFGKQIKHGAPVNTKFKHFEKVNGVWFQHK
jgi:glycosyltransferase involved in cell wall biosynthesis